MLTEFVDKIQQLTRKTDETITLYGNYTTDVLSAKYNDHNQQYEIRTVADIERSVSTIESLISAIKEEVNRRNNSTGKYTTVTFTEKGGLLNLDDDFSKGVYKFNRRLSSQWEIINNNIDKTINHQNLLILLQSLKPSFKEEEYEAIYNAFLEIKFKGDIEVNSKPILINGEGGEEYKFKFKATGNNHEEEMYLPESFNLTMPYTKASEYTVNFEIKLLITFDDSRKPLFRLIFPEKEAIIEQAVKHEVDTFKAAVTEMTELLILEDY